MSRPIPGKPVPALSLPLVDGGHFTLADAAPDRMTLLVFYRGLHCPICKSWLGDLNEQTEAFAERGVAVLAVSMDEEARARKTRQEWDIDDVPLGYAMDEDTARDFGLYMSSKLEDSEEPERFCEPGVFLVRPDGTLYGAAIQTMPFTRPGFDEILQALDFVEKKDYPPRGKLG